MSNPNDYELGYDEGYQDGTAINHDLAGLVTERDQWKARAEKAERDLAKTEHMQTTWMVRSNEWKSRAEKAETALQAQIDLVAALKAHYTEEQGQ